MKTVTYIYPEKKYGKNVTITLIKDGYQSARGLAIVNPNDQYSKKLGKAISYGRAEKALSLQYSSSIINRDGGTVGQFVAYLQKNNSIDILLPSQLIGNSLTQLYKSIYMPKITDEETDLLYKLYKPVRTNEEYLSTRDIMKRDLIEEIALQIKEFKNSGFGDNKNTKILILMDEKFNILFNGSYKYETIYGYNYKIVRDLEKPIKIVLEKN